MLSISLSIILKFKNVKEVCRDNKFGMLIKSCYLVRNTIFSASCCSISFRRFNLLFFSKNIKRFA